MGQFKVQNWKMGGPPLPRPDRAGDVYLKLLRSIQVGLDSGVDEDFSWDAVRSEGKALAKQIKDS